MRSQFIARDAAPAFRSASTPGRSPALLQSKASNMRFTRGFKTLGTAGLVAALWGGGTASPALAGGIAPDLARQIQKDPTSGKSVRVIVRFARRGVDSNAVARGHRGQAACKHRLTNGATLIVSQKEVAGLTRDPNVAWVSPDRAVGAQWDCGVQTIGADQVWLSPGCQGNGIGIAVLDTGAKGGSDLNVGSTGKSWIAAWQDF